MAGIADMGLGVILGWNCCENNKKQQSYYFFLEHWRYIMSKVRTLISITVIFSMSLTPIYGYTGNATHVMEWPPTHIVPQPPVVGAVLKSLGDNQFCISSTIGKPDLVPSIFTEADNSNKNEITDIVNAFSSMGVPLCTNDTEKTMRAEVKHINTTLVDSEMYSNQGIITRTVVDRIRGLVNNNIKIKTGELFHFQAPSFISIADEEEEMFTSMETIEKVQEIYTRVFSSNNESSPQEEFNDRLESEEFLVKKNKDLLVCLGAAVGGAIIIAATIGLWVVTFSIIPENEKIEKIVRGSIGYVLSGIIGGLSGGGLLTGEMEGRLLVGSLCGTAGALAVHHVGVLMM